MSALAAGVSIRKHSMGKHNDIDMSRWKEYEDITTDSLWLIDKRDNSGVHTGKYHGNFVPQIPYQLFSRYTKSRTPKNCCRRSRKQNKAGEKWLYRKSSSG